MEPRRVDNPPNPYLSRHHHWLESPPPAQVEIYEEQARSILSENDSPDLPFRWSINPYRGCQHACAYCYARPTHEYLGFGAGTDFDTRLVAKVNAADLLRAAFRRKSWRGESITFSGVTDCYQPIEAAYGLTRACLAVCVEFANPVGIVTKGCLVQRDIDVLTEIRDRADASVFLSIPFSDEAAARAIEPQAPPPTRRFETLRRMSAAGIRTGVMVAPLIPGLNDRDVPAILSRAAEAGARSACYMPLRLPGSAAEVFLSRLRDRMPQRARRVVSRIREIRGGCLSESRFGRRMRGEGWYWASVRSLFELSARRSGLRPETSGPPEGTVHKQPVEGCRPIRPKPCADGQALVQLNLPFE